MLRRIILAFFVVASATAAFVPADAQECGAAGTVGSGGSAAAGDTSASTIGTAGTCRTDDGTTSSIGAGGSAATSEGKAKSQTKINENPSQLQGRSKAQAMDKGTFSKSQTKTKVTDDGLQSRTKTMSHVPGEKPTKSKTKALIPLPPPE
ncbi:hypothetical protein KEM44_09870 (plasmid) [Sinorhizobium meliloti]|uniref:hypothetical protein n=1 Tax=Rhizobium meliloti TaxID=382 RepID=UPI000B5A287C|nr:hypothetical protein [Sinorhizobium meliloti]ASJ62979.1 hypothetical protein SMB554_28605 [Sinorhizobium meliloti]MCK3787309.1 hypothetical protein [Sinorhizobium meliloti]MCK3792151.1 hypothetical protein [Sinorhizobium meliloti]MCK3798526.1 hypothetical protein [Sinorhizobium meliloti]UTG96337.1 hypothetical protein KEM44_09870 [Sinorhizobium meliloti]